MNYLRKSSNWISDHPVCKNDNEKCEYWSIIGECDANSNWMKRHCPKACKACDSGEKAPGNFSHTADLYQGTGPEQRKSVIEFEFEFKINSLYFFAFQ